MVLYENGVFNESMRRCYEPDREEIDPIICNRCKHRRKGITCDAFPEGIPIEIIRSGEHFLPVDGDHGIVFEEKDVICELITRYSKRIYR